MKKYPILLIVCFLLLAGCSNNPSSSPIANPTSSAASAPSLSEPSPIYDLPREIEPIPQYSKLELQFGVQTEATNLQFPYDENPPAGVEPKIGVTVDALFTPDHWETVFIQPAFYYQAFISEEREGQAWRYPTDDFHWRVRFTPHLEGEWQYKIRLQDAEKTYETEVETFMVIASEEAGFIQVSENDSRYFEFSDGSYFPGIGLNLSVADQQDEFAALSENSIQLIRTFLPSQYSIWGAAWSPWRAVGAIPVSQETNARLRFDAAAPFSRAAEDAPLAVPNHDFFLWLTHDETVFEDGQQRRHFPCVVMGWNTEPVSVNPDQSYQLRVRYRLEEVSGPKQANAPFGLAVKSAHWLWHRQDETQRCSHPGNGELWGASYEGDNWNNYPDPEHKGWMIMETAVQPESSFLPRFWLSLENATAGHLLIDQVWLEEELPNGRFGPNVLPKASMAPHLYFDQHRSFAFDEMLEAAEAHDLYLKLVLLEKGDYALNAFEPDGSLTTQAVNQSGFFFGNGRSPSKILWLQKAYWRYVQARWGYSTHIHSWELLNEGNPASEAHHILADELGRYMQTAFVPGGQTTPHPNMHLVTTSFWSGYAQPFWQNEAYPYIDYADIHHYALQVPQRPFANLYDGTEFNDAAAFTQKLSEAIGGNPNRNPGMPLVRGELGFVFENENLFAQNVSNGLWLHNLLWAGLNHGGLMELYWTGAPIQNQLWSDAHDHRPIFKAYANFVTQLPLNNGRYQPLQLINPNPQLRIVGQMDNEAGQAHLWIQNQQHTWKNVVDGVPITAVTSSVQLSGFSPNQTYTVSWVDTYVSDGDPIIKQEMLTADGQGILTVEIINLETDVALLVR